jgi:hypothetical protein
VFVPRNVYYLMRRSADRGGGRTLVPWLLGVLLAACGPLSAFAQTGAGANQPPPSVSAYVPVVGSTLGADDIVWKTQLELDNTSSTEVTVGISLPAAPEQPLLILTMPPGSVQRFSDVVGEAFGLERAMSPLLVQTQGRRSVTIRASAYGVRGADVFRPEPIAVSYGEPYYPIRYLNGLSFSNAYRTNIGLANLGDEEATFVVAFQRVPDRNLAVSRFTVPPNTLWHQSVQALFPMIDTGDDFSVLVETFSRHTFVYASVIDNATNEARFVDAIIGAPSQAQ